MDFVALHKHSRRLSLRGMAVATLAALLLLVQPLASSAWCLAAGMDCCSSLEDQASVEEAAPASCCGSSALDLSEEGDAPAEPCSCEFEREPASDLPPVDAGSVAPVLTVVEHHANQGVSVRLLTTSRRPAYRARAPGNARPPRVLYQVFRL